MHNDTLQSSSGLKDESQLVTFLLKDEEFGFDIMSIQEIIRVPKMARVPRSPAYVDGIANLRGVVLPVIDMRTRFGMERATETDRTRVLVVDINGVKTGLRVDRVNQVTRVMRSEIEAPPPAIRGTTSDYLEGVVKLDKGERIVMALNAAHVCDIDASRPAAAASGEVRQTGESRPDASPTATAGNADVLKMVTFRIAREEFAFHLEHVREILRVQTPNQVPDVPDYLLGVLTVRGQILPVIDLRRLLKQGALADEFGDSCRQVRESYEHWLEQAGKTLSTEAQVKVDLSATEQLRTWLAVTNSSSQLLMESLSAARGLNEMVIKQVQVRTKHQAHGDGAAARGAGAEALSAAQGVIAALRHFERDVATHIQEDQRIIVVDSAGCMLGLVVDHVHEVLNVPASLVEPPPRLQSNGGIELSGVAKLDDGARLIMLLDVANLIQDGTLREIQSSNHAAGPTHTGQPASARDGQELSEVQLVTFMLGDEEFGVPISQIQEIDRLARITRVPKAAPFIEGVTNLRGEVIPVLNTRMRFGLEARPSDDRTRIIIVDLGGVKTGIVVDSVREVMNLLRKDIAPPPEAIGSGVDQQFISGIGKVDDGKRMIVLLDVERILSGREKAQLSEVTGTVTQ